MKANDDYARGGYKKSRRVWLDDDGGKRFRHFNEYGVYDPQVERSLSPMLLLVAWTEEQ